jgi:hypothetical protein
MSSDQNRCRCDVCGQEFDSLMHSKNTLDQRQKIRNTKTIKDLMLTNIISRENVFTHPSLLNIPSILEAASFTQSDNVKTAAPIGRGRPRDQ